MTIDVEKKPSAEHIVLVRDSAGKLVHTHEVIYFGAEPLSDSAAQNEAIEAAKAIHRTLGEGLTASMASRSELAQLRAHE